MDYSKTLNLPKTEFPMRANLSKREPAFLEFWQEIGLYDLLRQKGAGKQKYILHDGPPYANGHIHMGHALNKVLKDIIVKFKNMTGFDAPYVPGWACHGLSIEHKVAKTLKPGESKIRVREMCHSYALSFVDIQRDEFKRLGVFGDWENPYLTLLPSYCASILEAFGELVRAGYVYKGRKPVHWCASCKTALAEAEVEYLEKSSPSIYVKFPLKKAAFEFPAHTSVLIWTTTPWTLPANVAIALGGDHDYALVKAGEEVLIMAKRLIPVVMKEAGILDYELLGEIRGKELEGGLCENPLMGRESRLILGDYVTLDQGTGCVHTAPGHGLEDYEAGLRYGLPILNPVDDNGRFTDEAGEFAGENVFAANKLINERLKEKGFLLYRDELTHSYPHCWRCKKPVLFRATSQWFISMDKNSLRQRSLEAAENVRWIPSWGENRFYGMLKDRPDWCISRQRAWGVPIPAFYCLGCGQSLLDVEVIKETANIVRKEGMDIWFKKEPDYFLKGVACPKCGGKEFRREEDILDVWFDSGSSHLAVLKQRDDLSWPADLYLEGSDQHRGWFQSSLLVSMGATQAPPYKGVLTHGFMVDAEGKAMSKSMGNTIAPEQIIKKFGADILRLWVISEDYRADIKLSDEILTRMADSYRKMRNTFRFLLGNLYDFDPEKDSLACDSLRPIDKYLLSRLQALVSDVRKAYTDFEFHRIYHLLNNFCVATLSSFYLDVAKDVLYTFKPDSKERRAIQTVMHKALLTL
ncbi:isoleucine--tRNA ligase, partial [bacterium]|nr:isoleucine--tRNA ligase [bacterium]